MIKAPPQHSVEEYRKIASQLFEKGDMGAYYELAERVEDEYPETPDRNFLWGVYCFKQGDMPKAQEFLVLYVSERPEDFEGHCVLGRVLQDRGERAFKMHNMHSAQILLDQSVEQYSEAIELNPRDITSISNLANLYLRAGYPERTLECFNRALQIEPDSLSLNHNSGSTRLQLGIADEETGRQLSKAWNADKTFFEAGHSLFLYHAQTGKSWDAMLLGRQVRAAARLCAESGTDPGRAKVAANVMADIDKRTTKMSGPPAVKKREVTPGTAPDLIII